jgi:hypothetical protein
MWWRAANGGPQPLELQIVRGPKATMMDILSEKGKTEYPKPVTKPLRLEDKRFVQGVCYFIQRNPKLIKKKKNREKEVNVQNINSIELN